MYYIHDSEMHIEVLIIKTCKFKLWVAPTGPGLTVKLNHIKNALKMPWCSLNSLGKWLLKLRRKLWDELLIVVPLWIKM